MPTLSRLLVQWGRGEPEAFDELAPLVYGELSKLASGYLRWERRGATVETGVLVHEALLRLLRQRPVAWADRSHFYGLAALMMRRILLDRSRRHRLGRRLAPLGGTWAGNGSDAKPSPASGALDLRRALDKLGERYPEAAEVVELHFLQGLRQREVARRLGVSVATVKRRWRMARAWLRRYFESAAPP